MKLTLDDFTLRKKADRIYFCQILINKYAKQKFCAATREKSVKGPERSVSISPHSPLPFSPLLPLLNLCQKG